MAGVNQLTNVMGGLINETPTVFANTNLGTVVTPVTMCVASLGQIRRVKISNLSTVAANTLAYQVVPTGAADPVFTATPGAGAGVILAIGQVEYFAIPQGFRMFIVGGAAATSYSVVTFSI